MKKRNTKHTRRIKNLVFICALCAILLSVSTYAWFIGMKTVNVSSFDISIATTEGLFLSMDGDSWSYELDAKKSTAYTNNTNTWADEGLIPMSTIGDMDSSTSTMIMFEKGSLTTTRGGYRLLASRVHNYDTTNDTGSYKEAKGYVAFDLFIKNLSGSEYYFANNELNEEAIYLTTNSKVTVASDGGEAGTGIENSVRVAFTQIGRVKADTEKVGNITAIKCSNVAAATGQVQVTGICRNAQIWEPNDKAHVSNAINWYDTSCLSRKDTGSDVTLDASYDKDVACSTIINNPADAYATYAVSRTLDVADNVDVYDGADYNKYTKNTKTYSEYITAYKTAVAADNATSESIANAMKDYKLVEYPYFTDTMKDKIETARPQFMTLAPNSITKLRVYIYIEGQDVDNYDFASLGKKISVQFGFTKERYNEEDPNLEYEGPNTHITSTVTE